MVTYLVRINTAEYSQTWSTHTSSLARAQPSPVSVRLSSGSYWRNGTWSGCEEGGFLFGFTFLVPVMVLEWMHFHIL